MIKVLHELGSLSGGVARLLYDYYSNIDRTKIQFDFLVQDYYTDGVMEQPLKELGTRIFKAPSVEQGKKRFVAELNRVISGGGYDIVHSHRGPQSFYALLSAKRNGVKIRVSHSHLAFSNPSFARKVKDKALIAADKLIATDLFACGKDAGVAMWGKKAVESGAVKIIINAVNTGKLAFSQKTREQKRRELGVDDKFVIGAVGRLEEQKNYPFLLKVFKEVLKADKNTVLVIAGGGSLEDDIKLTARETGLSDSVLFLGMRTDVNELLCAFDVLAMPSLYEGLPVALVEAQTNGLPAVAADTITDEMAVTDLIKFLPLENPALWSKTLLESKAQNREDYRQIMARKGYEIKTQAKNLEEFYLSRFAAEKQ